MEILLIAFLALSEKKKKKKKEKREHRKHPKEEPATDASFSKSKIKVEKEDPDYERYARTNPETWASTSGHRRQSRMPQGHELKYESGAERPRERGSEWDKHERRTPFGEHRKTEAVKDRHYSSGSRSRDRSENRDKPSWEKSSNRY